MARYKRIGILGGLSPESTVTYYQLITRRYTERFGDYAYPEIIIFSCSFQDYVDWQENGEWDKAKAHMVESIKRLAQAGADFAIVASNTMHRVFEEVSSRVPIP